MIERTMILSSGLPAMPLTNDEGRRSEREAQLARYAVSPSLFERPVTLSTLTLLTIIPAAELNRVGAVVREQ